MRSTPSANARNRRRPPAGTRPSYYVQAAVTGDEAAAIRTLTELVDAGYDGDLISGEVGGSVLYEVRLGPYPSIDQAQQHWRHRAPLPRAGALGDGRPGGAMSQALSPVPCLDLAEILRRNVGLSDEQLAAAREEQAASGGRLVDALVSAGHVTAEQVLEALSQQLQLPIRPQIGRDDIDEALVERVPIAFAKAHLILPLQREPLGSRSRGGGRPARHGAPWTTCGCSSTAPTSSSSSPPSAR